MGFPEPITNTHISFTQGYGHTKLWELSWILAFSIDLGAYFMHFRIYNRNGFISEGGVESRKPP